MDKFKKDLIEIGRWIWEKDLTGGLSGNISARVSPTEVLITGTRTCLGALTEAEVGLIDLEGNAKDRHFTPSSEKPFHLTAYKALETLAVIHVHPTFTNAYFSVHDKIEFDTFETRMTLGDVPVVDQTTPTITDISPVIQALKRSNIVVLKHHGVVAVGQSLRDAFFLVQTLEEGVRINCIKDLYAGRRAASAHVEPARETAPVKGPRFKIFSKEQIQAIVDLVNKDAKFRELALQTSLETKLAVVQEETEAAFCFHFTQGGIKEFTTFPEGAEFVISGRTEDWRAIFNRQLDPFAATTQKRLKLKGDFAKISRWYVPFNRLFELWTAVPVE